MFGEDTSKQDRLHDALPDIGRRIREARRDAGLTQTQLGALLGDSQAAVAQVERKTWMGEAVLAKYARALAKSLAYFVQPVVRGERYTGSVAARAESMAARADAARARLRRVRRMAAINRAFQELLQDPSFAGGARSGGILDLEAKKELVRRYEAARGVELLPPEIV